MTTADEILGVWLDEVGPEGWYQGAPALDCALRARFEAAWRRAAEGAYGLWLTYPSGALAYIILTDQFPRNMFRATAQAFATDKWALAAAKAAIRRKWDLRIDEPARQFFYLPLMHSESLSDQEHCVRLVMERMPETGAGTLLHARAHRDVIRMFGRFPSRNAALGRPSREPETAYVEHGGYRERLKALQKLAGAA